MFYEVPGATLQIDHYIAKPTWYGPSEAWSQYSPAVARTPDGSDLITEWEFMYGLAQRLGLNLEIRRKSLSIKVSGAGHELDMNTPPSADELLAMLTEGGRVPLDEVKCYPGGRTFPETAQIVLPKQAGWEERLELGNTEMLADLQRELPNAGPKTSIPALDVHPFTLVSVRPQQIYNSTVNLAVLNRGRAYNPAYLHPADLSRLGLASGDTVEIVSATSSIPSIVEADPDLREGLVAMSYGFGGHPDRDREFRAIGSSPARLLDGGDVADAYSGMPRINVRVNIRRAS
jgi:anaerobic selenocysteine-containing dehydrogenase